MSTLFRGRPRAALTLLFLALPVVIGATCQPVKKTPPPEVAPAPPGVQPDPCAAATVVINAAQLCGWLIQPDANNATEGGFSSEAASIGSGSLKGGPIGTTAAEKFIAVKGMGVPVSDVVSIGYDFLIAGTNPSTTLYKQFYLNVYVNIDDSDNFYDCRFDHIPAAGSTTAFTTESFAATDNATNVARRGTRIDACPATLAGMPAGSFVRAFALNIGDTSAGDNGLAGYYDNVQLTTSAGTTTYDFEA